MKKLLYRCWCGYVGTEPKYRKHDDHLGWRDWDKNNEGNYKILTKQVKSGSNNGL